MLLVLSSGFGSHLWSHGNRYHSVHDGPKSIVCRSNATTDVLEIVVVINTPVLRVCR